MAAESGACPDADAQAGPCEFTETALRLPAVAALLVVPDAGARETCRTAAACPFG
jgi:hypothetical protein